MRQEKELLKQEIKEHIDHHGSFVIIGYEGLSANAASDFRRDVAQTGGEVEMMRKRVLLKATDDLGIELDLAKLPGHIGLVFAGSDAVETTKLVFKYRKSTDKAIDVIGGRIDGELYDAADVEKLSKLPGMNEMRAQFLSVLEAPMGQTLAVMESLLTSIVYCLDNKSKVSSDQ